MRFNVEVLDTWNMTVTPVNGVFKVIKDSTYRYHAEGLPKVKLPGKPWMALRIKRVAGDQVSFKEGERLYGES
jgi:hypothetical protein